MNKATKTINLFLFLMVQQYVAFAQVNEKIDQRLTIVFDSICKNYALQGATACIIFPNTETWTAVYGESYAGVSIRKDMLMGISSNTKTFIAILMLKLQEMHKLHLNDTIGKWIANKKYINGQITIRQLLNHTSGIFNFTEYPSFIDSVNANHKRVWKKEDLLNLINSSYFEAGKGWKYSNTNYIIAGIIIEMIMNKPVEAVLQELIFIPQELRNTFYYPQQIPTNEIAHQWTINMNSKMVDLSTIGWSNIALFSMASSSGAILQTAEDNAKMWNKLFLGKIINQNSLREMMEFVDAEDNVSCGLGIYKYDAKSAINNRTSYGHGGTNFGFASNNIVDSISGLCISVLTNQDKIDEDMLLTDLIGNLQKVVLPAGTENKDSTANKQMRSDKYIILTGAVIDSTQKELLPFVNIGIKQKNIGTSSLLDGTFSIKIPTQNENDTLTFSMVGYSELNLPIKNIVAANQKIFQLKIKTTQLNSVVVTAKKLVEQKFGIKKNGAVIHFTDGSTNQNDIFEIAQLIKFDTIISKITSVNLHINESRNDSGTFRINFYKYDGNKPTERIIEKSIVQTKQIQEGWLKFDLTKYKVYLKGSFVVTIEFIPTKKKNNPIYYEVKLGGSSKSFVRTSSQGEWSVPPHHYRLFVTALVSENKRKSHQDDLDEKESIPTTTLFSESVKDSFSIFISFPKDYLKKKNQNFPVIYLLDANVYFDIIADAMKENNSNAILVGIGYKDFMMMDSMRNRDYTFPRALPQDSFLISGGADKFLFFIRSELLPYIDKTYRTDTSKRTLMGHSLGAYFTLYALEQEMLNKNSSFKNYVAASPSLQYCNNYLIKQFQNISDNENTKTLFLTFGAKEDSEDGTGTEGIDNFNSFITLMSDNKFKNIKLKSEVYPTFGHMETAVPTFTKTLQKIK